MKRNRYGVDLSQITVLSNMTSYRDLQDDSGDLEARLAQPDVLHVMVGRHMEAS